MDRKEKQEIKYIQDNENWYKSLPINRREFIRKLLITKIVNNDEITAAIIDTCLLAAIDDVADLSVVKCKEIMSKSNEYMAEYKEFLESNKKEGFEMVNEKALNDKVKSRIKELRMVGTDKAKALRQLRKEFNLPNAELSNIWIEVKEDELKGGKNKVVAKDIDEGVKEEVVVDKENKSKLKVINVVSEIQGEYGTYLKSDRGVEIGEKMYKDKTVVERIRKAAAAEYGHNMEVIKAQIEELNIQLKDIENNGIKDLEMYAELEAVFDL
jgi:hypothetical protein